MRIGVILLSGGLDSTTLAVHAWNETDRLIALTLDYGQRQRPELDAARAVAAALALDHRVVDVHFYRDLAAHSALTNADRFDLPSERDPAAMAGDIPLTYVPMRNTFFLTMAAAALESRVLHEIEENGVAADTVEPVLYIAANALDYSGYPDCRPEFYESIAETLRLGSKIGAQYDIPFQIETPLIDMSKADIVRLARDLDAPLHLTWSCYAAGPRPCGVCDSCLLRAKGFEEAGIIDPAL